MSLLKTAPPAAVRSLDEVFAIAHAMEHQAAACYGALAQRARAEGVSELADLFEHLAEEERSHATSVAQWSQQRSGTPPDPANIKWELPETFEREAAGELAASRLASAYRVLAMAVRNEERAFEFWSYVAAEAATPEVRRAAEQMAHEELGHVARLRRARRQAYHAERTADPRDRASTPIDRLAEAAHLERRLAGLLETRAARSTGEEQRRMHELAAQAGAMADEVAQVSTGGESVVAEMDAIATAERLVEDYLDVADLARDETIALQAQSLARRAILRLTWLRGLEAGKR